MVDGALLMRCRLVSIAIIPEAMLADVGGVDRELTIIRLGRVPEDSGSPVPMRR